MAQCSFCSGSGSSDKLEVILDEDLSLDGQCVSAKLFDWHEETAWLWAGNTTGKDAEAVQKSMVGSSGTALSRPGEAAKDETLGHLLAVLHHAARGAQHAAGTATPSNGTTAPWLQACRRKAGEQKELVRGTVRRKPAVPAMPSPLPQPDVSVALCGFESAQLAAAMAELASALQTGGAKRENGILDQLKNGFGDVFKECS
ncbi:uncharacterized protein LOC122182496 isoform X2 [Lagopus leucura]|uniref:uncharacterized protein LOC122182496 isoform X2 n=1 Tax=Lagopus leucura TaxID=30410 RepID=UPI001C680634|nr:uncharacterized protein LOC122182496 isoform X2 [Lagopus leucura]